jgi:glutamyl-tRNA reductase
MSVTPPPDVATLRPHLARLAEAELERAWPQLQHLSPQDRAAIARLSHRLVDTVIHDLGVRMRALARCDEVPPQASMRVLAHLLTNRDTPAEG